MNRILINLCFICLAMAAYAVQAETLDEILALSEPPTGVVIEVIEPGSKALEDTLDNISYARDKIRQRFPELPIAVAYEGTRRLKSFER